MRRLVLCSAIGSVALLLSLAPSGNAGRPQTNIHNESRLTFSNPVRVPGTTLPAGTYTFSVPFSTNRNRSIVKITSPNGDKVFATILAVSDYRPEPVAHTLIIFGNTGSCDGATPIKAWFSARGRYGYRFVYPEEQAAEIASACNEPVPETHSEAAKKSNLDPSQFPALEKSDVGIVTPTKQEEQYDPSELASGDKADQDGFDVNNQ